MEKKLVLALVSVFFIDFIDCSRISAGEVAAGERAAGEVAAGERAVDEAPAVAPVSTKPTEQPAQPFDVLDFAIDGNTVLDRAAIENAIYKFMGPAKSVDVVEQARAALEQTYHDAGYQTVLVVIPEQKVRGGVIALQVIEGRLQQVQVTQSRYFSLERIRATVPALAEGTVPNMPALQQQLETAANQSRDREITPILRAGDAPGMVDAELRVKDELPLHASLEVNNRNSSNTSPNRVIASLRYDNLWQQFHSASLQYQTAPADDAVKVWSATYVLPVFDDTWNWALYGAKVDSQSSVAAAGAISVLGTGDIYGTRLVKKLTPLDNYFHSLTFGADYKDFDQSVVLVGADDQETPISYLAFSLRYDGSWTGAENSVTTLSIGPNFSLRGLGNSQREFSDKRFLARSNYLYLVADLEHLQVLPLDFRARGKLSAQISDSPLISNEQFSVGGADSVRGYHESEVLGDQGAIASLELQSPRLLPKSWGAIDNFRLLTFVDGARIWVKEALPGTLSRADLSSAGIGLRFNALGHLEGSLDWAYPFVSAGVVKAGDTQTHFKLLLEF